MTENLSFQSLPQLAVAEGATTPNPGFQCMVWSPTTESVMQWNGSAWVSVASQATIAVTGVSYYFNNSVAQESTYKTLARTPPSGSVVGVGVTSAANPGALIAAFETVQNDPYALTYPAGTYTVEGYAYRASGGSGTNTIRIDFYNRTVGGVETLLFSSTGANITGTAIGSPTHWSVDYYQATPIPKALDDRLVIKAYAISSSGTRTITLLTGGTLTSSNIITPITASIGPSTGGGGAGKPTPFEVGTFIAGVTSNSEKVMQFIAADNITLAANLDGSYAKATVAATAETIYTIYKNGVSAGTITFAAAGTIPTFSTSGLPIELVPGDLLLLQGQALADATLANVSFTFVGSW
jgi:hypothetical protein